MADLPEASVTIDDAASAFAGSTGYVVVMGCVGKNADLTPRVFGSTKGLLAQHDYAPGVDYCALHMAATRKPVIFVGLPIATAGTIGRQNNSGQAGSSAITVAAGSEGVLEETDSSVTVVKGGTIGTDQISFDYSADGGQTSKRVRLGTASSYTIPYLGIVLNFGAGTLVAGDVFTFTTTAPMWDSDGLTAARTALAAQQKLARSWVVVGDLPNSTFAGYVATQANAYETTNQRFTYARSQVRDRLPLASKSSVKKTMTGAPNLTFLEVGGTGDTITRSSGSFVTDGFAVGDVVTVAGSVSNNVTGPIASLSATVLTFGTTDLANEGPVGGCSMVGSEGLVFSASGHTITRSTGSWLADGFAVGDVPTVAGTASNNGTLPAITVLTATVMTFGSGLADETIGSASVTMTKGETVAAWMSSIDSGFATVDAQKRVDLAAGRARKESPITGYSFRRPAAWAASVREYAHDLQIPCWRKDDGPLDGWSITDDNGNTVEFDERFDGGGLAARFTCLRSYGNGPIGAFVALSLTRAPEGSLLSRTHNMAVANLACTVVQAETENAIGQVLVLKDDGTATDASLSLIEKSVNRAMQVNLLQAFKEGPRASKAIWTASRTDVLDVPGATLNGSLALELNGTLERIDTTVRVQTAGA